MAWGFPWPRSLQTRLALAIGLGMTVIWLAAGLGTAARLSGDLGQLSDTTLRATAERLLPWAIHDVLRRPASGGAPGADADHDDEGDEGLFIRRTRQREGYAEYVSYIIRDAAGQVLIRSDGGAGVAFPPPGSKGFSQSADHRFYALNLRDGSLGIVVAEPLAARQQVTRSILWGLVVPLLAAIPLSLLGIAVVLRRGLRPLRALRTALGQRGAQDLSPLPQDADLPSELAPLVGATNDLLARLRAAFEAERSFAANAAHELRTPVAGALAQAQRLGAESQDPNVARRVADIEQVLKRLMRTSEKLMQFARAEGGRLLQDHPRDLRPVLALVVGDFARMPAITGQSDADRVHLTLPDAPVLSKVDPDALGILVRNLVENALRHGAAGAPVQVSLDAAGHLTVANAGPVLTPDQIARLMHRFEKGGADQAGTGLGLAIVRTIVDRSGAEMTVTSPAPHRAQADGVLIDVALPISGA